MRLYVSSGISAHVVIQREFTLFNFFFRINVGDNTLNVFPPILFDEFVTLYPVGTFFKPTQQKSHVGIKNIV